MSYQNPFCRLSRREYAIWFLSLITVTLSFFLGPAQDLLSLFSSLIGVTALILVAKGDVLGQILTIVFSILYAIVSYRLQYYGEMITYLLMSAPIALFATVSWLRHPHNGNQNEVTMTRLSKRTWLLLSLLNIVVTVAFYFILRALGTANLLVSTISVTTSFYAASLTFLRSPYYGIGYAANDVVLIILWISATVKDVRYLPMIFCFLAFLLNDVYGFWNWQTIRKTQETQVK